MSELTGFNVGLNYGYIDGEDGWGAGMNSNLIIIDSLIQGSVTSRVVTTPPVSPLQGAMWIVPVSATGAWAGQTTKIAIWRSFGTAGWVFRTPKNGWRFFLLDEQIFVRFNGTVWVSESVGVPGSGLFGYATVALMNADTTRAVGSTGAVFNDPDITNNFPRVAFMWNGSAWIKGYDNLSAIITGLATVTLESSITSTTLAFMQDYFNLPNPLEFQDTTQYQQAWKTISTPSSRFSIAADRTGYTITGLSGLTGGSSAVGIRIPGQDLVPGDRWFVEFVYTALPAGGLTSQAGFWFGVDTAASGDLSAASRSVLFRNGVLFPTGADFLAADGTHSFTPTWAGSATVAEAIPMTFSIQVLPDKTWQITVAKAGVVIGVPVIYSPALAAGSVIIGLNILNTWVGKITKVIHSDFTGDTIYVDDTVSVSGNGSFGAPIKSLAEVAGVIAAQQLRDQINIFVLSKVAYTGGLFCDEKIARRWRINGLPECRSYCYGYNPRETLVWTAVPGTTKVFSTPLKNGFTVQSFSNQPFVLGRSNGNPATPWIVLNDWCVPRVGTVPADLDPVVTGGFQAAAGQLYLRLPDDMTADPTGQTSVVVSRANSIIEVVGNVDLQVNNLVMAYASGHCFTGGHGSGGFFNSGAMYSGWLGNGIEFHSGSYIIDGCEIAYINNDGVGAAARPGTILTNTPIPSIIRNTHIHHTYQGDGTSQHATTGIGNDVWLFIENCWIHDCYKCGVTPAGSFQISGSVIERCGDSQVTLQGNGALDYVGKKYYGKIIGGSVDPQGLGIGCVKAVGYAGVGEIGIDCVGVWFGTPNPAGGLSSTSNYLALVSQLPVSGYVIDPTKTWIRFAKCDSEQVSQAIGGTDPTKVRIVGHGTAGTVTRKASNVLAF